MHDLDRFLINPADIKRITLLQPTSLFKSRFESDSQDLTMFVKTIKRHYDRVNADESIADEDKIDALLMKLGAEFLMSQEDRVYVFQKGELTAKFDAKHARAYHFKDYVVKDMNKLFHGF